MRDSWCICGRPLIFNALILEGKRYWHVLSFAYCVRMNHFCSSNRDVQFPWHTSCPCHVTRFLDWPLGQWASPISSLSASRLKYLWAVQCQLGREISALEFVRWEMEQSLVSGGQGVTWCIYMLDRRSCVCCISWNSVLCVWLLPAQSSFILNLINCLCPQHYGEEKSLILQLVVLNSISIRRFGPEKWKLKVLNAFLGSSRWRICPYSLLSVCICLAVM